MGVTMAQLDAQKGSMLTYVGEWPAEWLGVRPAADSWSALEVLDHVVRVEAGITRAAMAGMKEPHPLGVRDRLGFLMVERIFLSRYRVKVPGVVAQVLPGRNLELGEIGVRWESARREFLRLTEECAATGVRGGLFRHPVSGWMSFEQVLRFFSVHLVHHQYQLQRIRKSAEAGAFGVG